MVLVCRKIHVLCRDRVSVVILRGIEREIERGRNGWKSEVSNCLVLAAIL